MFKKLKQFTLQLIAGTNVGTILLMLLVGYSDRLSPAEHPLLSTIGLSFPIFLLLNIGFLIFWLFVKKRYALIPIIGLLLAFQPVRNYSPLNIPHSDDSDSTLKVITFNAYDVKHVGQTDFRKEVADYFIAADADIICTQEYSTTEEIRELLESHYAYIDTTKVTRGGEWLTVMSKYPIVGKEKIYTDIEGGDGKAARSAAFFVKIDGDTVAVVNNHLESTGLTVEERSSFKRIVKGDLERDDAERESKKLIERLAESNQLREPQANAIVCWLDSILTNTRYSVILCGDFNDGPISYAHHAVNTLLTDCYAEGGLGPAISYHDNGLYVRIDHIFCSKEWKPINAKVDTKTDLSDHYPVVCTLKKQRNH
ncbi:MAG: endonuclease/exonuclease/phosphatase family protein [Prevotella sp.]|nr:endonuclease/exonuclease/phosphatase family protein [Prevotella sp.]